MPASETSVYPPISRAPLDLTIVPGEPNYQNNRLSYYRNPLPVLIILAGIMMVIGIGAIIFTFVVTAKHGIVRGDAGS